MTYWLFGIVVIVWAAVLVWTYTVTAPAGPDLGAVIAAALPTLVIVLVLAVVVYLAYRYWYLPRGTA
jgi:hypothetical protein